MCSLTFFRVFYESRYNFFRIRSFAYPHVLYLEKFAEKLRTKGVLKFIAFDVPLDMTKEKYGLHFDIIPGDLKQSDDLRVLDYNGHNIMELFSLKEPGSPLYYE